MHINTEKIFNLYTNLAAGACSVLVLLFLPLKFSIPIIGFLTCLYYLLFTRETLRKYTKHCTMTFTILVCILLCDLSISAVGLMHGMYNFDKSIPTVVKSIQNSPNMLFEDKPADGNYNGSIVILYKFGCKDCEAIYDNLQDTLQEHPDAKIYWLSSRSKDGKAFLDKYPTESVPTGFYIYKNQYRNVNYIQKPLNLKDSFNENGLNRLLELQQQDMKSFL